jgi:hypothetical protein
MLTLGGSQHYQRHSMLFRIRVLRTREHRVRRRSVKLIETQKDAVETEIPLVTHDRKDGGMGKTIVHIRPQGLRNTHIVQAPDGIAFLLQNRKELVAQNTEYFYREGFPTNPFVKSAGSQHRF